MKKINGGSTFEEDEEKKTHKGKNQCKEEKKKKKNKENKKLTFAFTVGERERRKIEKKTSDIFQSIVASRLGCHLTHFA